MKCPHLVLVRSRLAGDDGMDLLRTIKAVSKGETSVISISDERFDSREECGGIDEQADDFLVKPVTASELLERVRLTLIRRQTAQALRASHQHFRQLLAVVGEAVLWVSLQGQMLRANAQAVAMLGYSDEAELMNHSAFGLIQPDEREQFRCLLASTLAMEVRRNQAFRLVRKGGQFFPAEISAASLEGSLGCPPVLVFVVRDISLQRTVAN